MYENRKEVIAEPWRKKQFFIHMSSLDNYLIEIVDFIFFLINAHPCLSFECVFYIDFITQQFISTSLNKRYFLKKLIYLEYILKCWLFEPKRN
jgi:hypothetical protein